MSQNYGELKKDIEAGLTKDAWHGWIRELMDGPADEEFFTLNYPFAKPMIGCPHDPVYHAEGDPWTHTILVVRALEERLASGGLTHSKRGLVGRIAAWAHDIGKPATTKEEWCDNEQRTRVRQPGHAPLGADMIYEHLLDAGFRSDLARSVYQQVFWHMRPPHMVHDLFEAQGRIIHYSHEEQIGGWRDLLSLCHSDQDGRSSLNVSGSKDNLELLQMHIQDLSEQGDVNLMDEPWHFETDEARLKYLSDPKKRSAFYQAPETSGPTVVMMSGLPGAGKDTMIERDFPDLPVVSLDNIRDEMKISHGDNQGRALQASFEQVRDHLRKGQSFIWNATCLSRISRQKIEGLALDYGARIEAVSLDLPISEAMKRNAKRAEPLPDKAYAKLGRKREPILMNEVHGLTTVDQHGNVRRVFGNPEFQVLEPTPEYRDQMEMIYE
jgi:predicted kinase